jgi:hypothetical protein
MGFDVWEITDGEDILSDHQGCDGLCLKRDFEVAVEAKAEEVRTAPKQKLRDNGVLTSSASASTATLKSRLRHNPSQP